MTDPLRRPWAAAALLAAVVFVLYGRTLTYDFVNYDDYDLVVMNTGFLSDPSNILTAFTTHLFTSHREEGVYYRPLNSLTYFVDYALWGLDASGYHLTNLLLHAGATVALYYLVLALLTGPGPGAAAGRGPAGRPVDVRRLTAFFSALLFAVHPVQAAAVAWVAGRNDVLLGLLLIASFLCYVLQYREPRRRWMFPLSAALFAAALLTKESAIFFIPLYPLHDLVVRRESLEEAFSGRSHLRISTFMAIAAAYLVVRFNIFGAFIGAEELYGLIPLDNRLLMAPGLAFTNLLFLVWPAGLSIAHPIESVPWFEWPAIAVAVAACIAVAAAGIFARRREPVMAWSVAWLAAGMVPLMNVFPLAVPILEHRLYAVSAGFALVVVVVVARVLRARPAAGPKAGPGAPAPAAIAVLAAACLLLASLTWARLPVWANSEALWTDAIATAPEGARAYYNLAGYYFERQQFDRTAALLETYVALRPDDFKGYTKLRQTYFLAGRPMEAARVCRVMIDRDPMNPNRYVEAGILFEKLGMGDSVLSVYHEGLGRIPDAFSIHRRLGSWHQATGNAAGAAAEFAIADSLVRALREGQPAGGAAPGEAGAPDAPGTAAGSGRR